MNRLQHIIDVCTFHVIDSEVVGFLQVLYNNISVPELHQLHDINFISYV